MRNGLQCETLYQLAQVPPDVVALFEHAEKADPAFGLGWFQNLAATVFADGQGVCLHVLRLNGAAVAAMPLHVSAGRGGHVAQALGNFYTCLYAPAVTEGLPAEHLARLVAHIKTVHAPLASVSLSPLDAAWPSLQVLHRALRLAGLRTFSHGAFGNWYLPVSGGYAAYMASRPGEVRNTVKRMGKKFVAAGGRFEIVDTVEGTAAAMAAYVAVYNTSWKKPEPFDRFMPGLAQLCAQRGWLRLGLAWVGDRPVAAQFWMVAAGKAHIYKLAYDEAYKHLSPGSQLTALLMQRAMDTDGVTEIDYMKGDDAYKNQWMTHRRERVGLLAFNPRTAGGLMGLLREATARALVRLKLRKSAHDADTGAPGGTSPTPG